MSGVLITKPLKILEDTWTTGAEFVLPGQICQISLQQHAGGTWKLQHVVDGAWVDMAGDSTDTTMTWDSKAIQTFFANPQTRYRLTGGTVGAVAEAYVCSVLDTEEGTHFRIVKEGSA